jgi:IS1 family transposase
LGSESYPAAATTTSQGVIDAEHRLALCTTPGKRSAEHVQELVDDVKRRVPRLITTEEYAPYRQAILNAWGTPMVPERTGKPGRPATKARLVPPPALNFATVNKTRAKGRVVDVALVIVFGVASAIAAALGRFTVNTSRVERQNGTDRNRNARKVRKTCCFSKDWDVHEAVGYLTLYSYNSP